jgi:hypothetical protein
MSQPNAGIQERTHVRQSGFRGKSKYSGSSPPMTVVGPFVAIESDKRTNQRGQCSILCRRRRGFDHCGGKFRARFLPTRDL